MRERLGGRDNKDRSGSMMILERMMSRSGSVVVGGSPKTLPGIDKRGGEEDRTITGKRFPGIWFNPK